MNTEKATAVLLAALSALLYFLGLHFDCLFYLIFVFLVPLFYLFLKYKPSFLLGFFWGTIFYSCHFFSIFKILYNSSNLWWFFSILLVAYFSIWAGLWFYLINKFEYKILLILLLTNLYFFFVNYFILSFIEFGCGYSVSYPLNVFNLDFGVLKEFYFLLITLFSILMALFLINRNLLYLFFSVFFLLPFIFLKNNRFLDIDNSVCLSVDAKISDSTDENPADEDPLEKALLIKEEIEKKLKIKPHLKNVFFPESTFCIPLNEFDFILNWFPKDLNIFLCANWKDKNCVTNSVFHIYNGKIIQKCDKRRLMPLFEYIPVFFKFIPDVKKFMNNCPEIAPGINANFFINNEKYKILICSDLFFESIFEKFDTLPILLFINNAWFDASFQRLLFKTARVKKLMLVKY